VGVVKKRLKIKLTGIVQGVGFRPFVYRLAQDLQLTGWVNNSTTGVFIEVEGLKTQLEVFLQRLESEKPTPAQIHTQEINWLPPRGYTDFIIRPSVSGEKTAITLPDLSTCSECLIEIFNLDNRRYRYPFTNCTNCGPRYSIIEGLPYDRPATTMRTFSMCPQCQQEYNNPLDRRFHAQPNACPVCGPQLELWDKQGNLLAKADEALIQAVTGIKQGLIIAIKGLGGFQLVVNACNQTAVSQLRQRKQRPTKPFGVMYPNLESVEDDCLVSELERELLRSPQAPLVLVTRHTTSSIAANVAPDNPDLGVMLPSTPLHHLLTADLGFPIIATSGNLANEPICTNEQEALQRLSGIADLFLVHNRPISRPLDDSVVRVIAQRPVLLRRARGYAPLPLKLPKTGVKPKVLALGAHLKNTIAISIEDQVFLSQHIGDLDNEPSFKAFEQVIDTLQQLYDFTPDLVACDCHPDYVSSQYALQLGKPIITVQHHQAHVLAAIADNQLWGESVLGVAWDGTGYGLDGTIWGGEFFLVKGDSLGCERIASFLRFPLPGGDMAIKQPRRTLLGLLHQLNLDYDVQQYFSPTELLTLKQMLARKLNTPLTSSVGRLFDGVGLLLGSSGVVSFEGEAAMRLEYLARKVNFAHPYPFTIDNQLVNWQPTLMAILTDLQQGISPHQIAARFHHTLAEIIVKIAQQVGEKRVILTGGCFQNKYLSECTISKLDNAGFIPYCHSLVPPNDGSIALGQAIAALNQY
jgi:hydrogenase maturation protein HypF